MNKKIPLTQLKHLLKEVEHVFRCKVSTSANCNQLSREVQRKTLEYISPHTLRRFFGLVKTESSPSVYTLDVLSKYCGYQDWAEFVSEKIAIPLSNDRKMFAKWILDFYVPVSKWPNHEYAIACKNIAEHIVTDSALYKTVPQQLATLPNGQHLFFEAFPYIDGLGNGYRKPLTVYLQHKKDSYDAPKYFVNCLLFLGAYLTQNDKQIKQYYNSINAMKCPVLGEMHEIPMARYMGVQILYNQYIGNDKVAHEWLQKSLNEFLPPDFSKSDYLNYQFILSEHLFLAGHYQACIDMLGFIEAPQWAHNKPLFCDLGYDEVARAMLAISYLKLGRNDVGKQLFKSINPNAFCFTKSKLYTLYYLNQQLNMCGVGAKAKRKKLQQQIHVLIDETGFTYFSTTD